MGFALWLCSDYGAKTDVTSLTARTMTTRCAWSTTSQFSLFQVLLLYCTADPHLHTFISTIHVMTYLQSTLTAI